MMNEQNSCVLQLKLESVLGEINEKKRVRVDR